jgi:hypothetical protein
MSIYEFDLTYSLPNDIVVDAEGGEYRNAKVHHPIRKLRYDKLKEHHGMFHFFNDAFYYEQYSVIAPMWCFTTIPTATYNAGATSINVGSDFADEYAIGDFILIRLRDDSSYYDPRWVTGIVGSTITFTPGLVNNYPANFAFVAPAIGGIAKISGLESIARMGAGHIDVEVTERVFTGSDDITYLNTTPEGFLVRADEVSITGNLNSSRMTIGVETGVPDYYNYLDPTKRHSHVIRNFTFPFYDKATWQYMRQLFFNVRGREGTIHVPTFEGNLRVWEDVSVGSSTIKVSPRQYSEIWTIYPKLAVEYYGGLSWEILDVTNATQTSTYATITLANPLNDNLSVNDPISYVPKCRFLEDEFTISFKAKNAGYVETAFVEVEA